MAEHPPHVSPLVSICIPSYNRPHALAALLQSIDTDCRQDVEVVICEDCSPKREHVRKIVAGFAEHASFPVRYVENEENYGYDRNLRELLRNATGEYIIFMGDDDTFVPGQLDKFIHYLSGNRHLGYVLRTWQLLHANGQVETFNYFREDRRFGPGVASFVALYRISVFISGFTIRREWVVPYVGVDRFDGTLLFQMYLLAEVTLRHPSAFVTIPLTQRGTGGAGVPHFGSSKSERGRYTPGQITVQNSVNFMKGHFEILRYVDDQFGVRASERIRRDYSKYSYRVLAIQRGRGLLEFVRYHRRLTREVRINVTCHYYVYLLGLAILGSGVCDALVMGCKRIVGRTPSQ